MPIEGELTAPDDSLRSELEAAFGSNDEGSQGSSSEASSNDTGNEPESAVVDQVSSADEAGKETSADGRQRGPDGKFIAKTEAVAAEKAPAEIPSTDAAKASEVAAQPATNAPPAGWTAAEKAEWSKLSPAVQAVVSRREAEMDQAGRRWSEDRRRYEAALSPVAEAARRNGMNTEQGLQSLVRAQEFLERDAPAAIKWLAEAHGVNLATLAGQAPAEVSSATQAPDIEALVRRAEMAAQRSERVVAPIQQQWQQEQQRQQDMTVKAIEAFSVSPGHEHYHALEGTIALILPQVIEENPSWTNEQKLQDAYDRALYATPATRQQALAAREQAAEEKRRQEAAQRATKARGAAVSVTGSPQGSAGQEPAGSLRDEIMRAMTG